MLPCNPASRTPESRSPAKKNAADTCITCSIDVQTTKIAKENQSPDPRCVKQLVLAVVVAEKHPEEKHA